MIYQTDMKCFFLPRKLENHNDFQFEKKKEREKKKKHLLLLNRITNKDKMADTAIWQKLISISFESRRQNI